MGNKPSSSQENQTRQQPRPVYQYPQTTAYPPQVPSPYPPTAYHAPPYAQAPYQPQPQQYYNQPGPYNQYPASYPNPAPCTFGQPPRAPLPAPQLEQTQTVKNQVNLKKNTLKAIVSPSDPSRVCVQFALDASAACRATVFYNAVEDTSTSCRIYTVYPIGDPVLYDKGMDRKFPPEDRRVSTTSAYYLNTAAVPLTELTQPVSNRFPIIIRLEALTDKGREERRSLQTLEAGCGLPHWVQSQTTYAKFVKEPDNSWSVKVLKQKLWFEGEGYELQEIYGMEGNKATPAAGPSDDDIEGRECVICMSEERDTTVLPCRHLCMCDECARALRNQTNKCPICRNPIEALLRIQFHNGANNNAARPR